MDRRRQIRVYALSGFLGAGKTTLLKRILSWGAYLDNTVVIVNEFGDVGIDKMLLGGTDSQVIELPGGCLCCSLRTNLIATLQHIQNTYHPKQIFIEASGVADPASIIDTLSGESFRSRLTLAKIITVVEADFWDERGTLGSFFQSQLETADLILLNKIDTIMNSDCSRILEELRDQFPTTPVLPTVHCDLQPETIFGPTDRPRWQGSPEYFSHQHDVDAMGFVTRSFEEKAPLDSACFERIIASLSREGLRIKGTVRYRDRSVMVNSARGRTEWKPWKGPAETRLALIGHRTDVEGMIERIRRCVCGRR